MVGNEEDFTAALGFVVEGVDERLSALPVDAFAAMIDQVAVAHPNFSVIATTLRTVRSATVNDWGALAWSRSTGVVQAAHRERLEILDRVGGGDSFASGLIYGLIDGQSLQVAVEYGAAHGALAMTTPGDTTMATRAEVLKLAAGGGARVDRRAGRRRRAGRPGRHDYPGDTSTDGGVPRCSGTNSASWPGVSGRAKRYPCARWQPRSISIRCCSRVSMPSAITSISSPCAIMMMVLTSSRLRGSVSRRATKLRSILSASMGKRCSASSEE